MQAHTKILKIMAEYDHGLITFLDREMDIFKIVHRLERELADERGRVRQLEDRIEHLLDQGRQTDNRAFRKSL